MKKQVTTKIKQEVADKIAEIATNTNKFASDIYSEAIEKYALGNNESPQNSAEIQELKAEISSMKVEIETLELQNQELENQLSFKKETISSMQTDIATLTESLNNQEPAPTPENAILLNHNEFLKLQEITEHVNQRGKTNFTPGELLFKVFYMQATQGAGDWLPKIYKRM